MNGHTGSVIHRKPLLICPNADLSQKLGAAWHAVEKAEPLVECPRYLEVPALRDLVGGLTGPTGAPKKHSLFGGLFSVFQNL